MGVEVVISGNLGKKLHTLTHCILHVDLATMQIFQTLLDPTPLHVSTSWKCIFFWGMYCRQPPCTQTTIPVALGLQYCTLVNCNSIYVDASSPKEVVCTTKHVEHLRCNHSFSTHHVCMHTIRNNFLQWSFIYLTGPISSLVQNSVHFYLVT